MFYGSHSQALDSLKGGSSNIYAMTDVIVSLRAAFRGEVQTFMRRSQALDSLKGRKFKHFCHDIEGLPKSDTIKIISLFIIRCLYNILFSSITHV